MKRSHDTTNIATGCAALLLATCAPWNAIAADGGGTWRCGNAYSDQPCQGGRRIDVDDARGAMQKRDADNTIRDAHAAASRMEGERRQLEAMGSRNRPILIDNAPRRDVVSQTGEGKAASAKLRKGKKEVVYTSLQAGMDSTPKKKSKKTKKQSGD